MLLCLSVALLLLPSASLGVIVHVCNTLADSILVECKALLASGRVRTQN